MSKIQWSMRLPKPLGFLSTASVYILKYRSSSFFFFFFKRIDRCVCVLLGRGDDIIRCNRTQFFFFFLKRMKVTRCASACTVWISNRKKWRYPCARAYEHNTRTHSVDHRGFFYTRESRLCRNVCAYNGDGQTTVFCMIKV
jgi:hypothetical protein